MYQAGTLSGNPLAMAAGIEMLKFLSGKKSIYAQLEKKSARLERGLQSIIDKHELPLTQNRVGSMFTLFFTKERVVDYETAKTSDTKKFAAYFSSMLDQGIYLAPSQFEAAFMSAAHTDDDIDRTIRAAEKALLAAFHSRFENGLYLYGSLCSSVFLCEILFLFHRVTQRFTETKIIRSRLKNVYSCSPQGTLREHCHGCFSRRKSAGSA